MSKTVELTQEQHNVIAIINQLYLGWRIDGAYQGNVLVKVIDDAAEDVNGVELGEHEKTFEIRPGGWTFETMPVLSESWEFCTRTVNLEQRLSGGDGYWGDAVRYNFGTFSTPLDCDGCGTVKLGASNRMVLGDGVKCDTCRA